MQAECHLLDKKIVYDSSLTGAETDLIQDIKNVVGKGTAVSYLEKVYRPYLWKTTQEMVENSAAYRLNHSLRFIATHFDVHSSDDLVVGIICFGRSLTYLLKYIAYTFFDVTTTTESLHIYLIADRESAQLYRNEEVEINQTPGYRYRLRRGFHRQLGHYESANDEEYYGLTVEELAIIANISITLISCSHQLAKGGGGKRAIIQYLGATVWSNGDERFDCMTIDDNITGIYKNCSLREKERSRQKSCEMVSCLTVYRFLRGEMDRYGSLMMTGINKGGGHSDALDKTRPIFNTVALYKLNVSRPVMIKRAKVYYNPYFTRFYEDIAFNAELTADTTTKNNAIYIQYHLNFGHLQSDVNGYGRGEIICSGKKPDHDDNFPPYLKSRFPKIEGIEPYFSMYYLYFVAIYDAGQMQMVFIEQKEQAGDGIGLVRYPKFLIFGRDPSKTLAMPKESKYTPYIYIVYFFMVIYVWNRPVQGIVLETQVCNPRDDMSELAVKWINSDLLQLTLKNDQYRYSFNPMFSVPIGLGYGDLPALQGHSRNRGQIADLVVQFCKFIHHIKSMANRPSKVWLTNDDNSGRTTRRSVKRTKKSSSKTRSRSQSSTGSRSRARSKTRARSQSSTGSRSQARFTVVSSSRVTRQSDKRNRSRHGR